MSVRTIIQHSGSGYAMIVGQLTQNDPHRHYSMHLALGLEEPLPATVAGDETVASGALVIDSWAEHRIGQPRNGGALIVSMGPASGIGAYLRGRLGGRSWSEIESAEVEKARRAAFAFTRDEIPADELCATLDAALSSIAPVPFAVYLEQYDKRILRALRMLGENTDGFLPATRVASEIGISESRFLHLFRAQMGITYRRMQLWIRLARSFAAVASGRSLTEIAYEFGFADSAHFSRAFRQAFGMPPSTLVQDSRFIQVNPRP